MRVIKDPEERKNEILDAAEKFFTSKGYAKTTINDLLNEVGIAKGNILFEGEDISDWSDAQMSNLRLQRMGFIFQHSHLLRTLSIRDNIVLPGFKAKKESREQVISYAAELMSRTGISQIADHDMKKVSGGQLQRAAICRALINRPDIIFEDEPTGALNSSATEEIMDIMNEINREGTAIMLVTHSAKVAARAERVIYLSDGKIAAEKELGKYEGKDLLDRERNMVRWLEGLEF